MTGWWTSRTESSSSLWSRYCDPTSPLPSCTPSPWPHWETLHSQHTVEVNFKEKMNALFSHLTTDQYVDDDDIRSLLFGDYMKGKDEQRLYDEVEDIKSLRTVSVQCYATLLRSAAVCLFGQKMEHYLEDYNLMSKAPMDLVMFRFAIEHISRISRILKQPNGHALLVGQSPLSEGTRTAAITFDLCRNWGQWSSECSETGGFHRRF